MDPRLMSWAHAVKSRRRQAARAKQTGVAPRAAMAMAAGAAGAATVAWAFTDTGRTPDVLGLVRALPPGAGLVFRHDGVAGRLALAASAARLCRARRITMVMTPPLIAGVGVHLRGGRHGGPRPLPGLRTSSAHSRLEVLRACRAGAGIIFLSPLFDTLSHPGAVALGSLRWRRLARGGAAIYALGGVTGATAPAIPRIAAGFGAIGSFSGSANQRCVIAATVFRDCHDRGMPKVADLAAARQ